MPEAAADLEHYIPLYEGDVTRSREILGFSPYIWCMMWLGVAVLPELGRLEEARRLRDQALELAVAHGDVEVEGWAHSNFPIVAWASGEPEDALDHARKGIEIGERLGSPFSLLAGCLNMAVVHGLRDEWQESEAWAARSLELIDATRTGVPYRSPATGALAEAALGQGRTEEARILAGEAVDQAQHARTRGFEARCRLLLGRVLLAVGEAAEAGDELRSALALSRELGLVVLEAKVHEALAELAAAEGDATAREAELREALRMHREHGATGHERRLVAQLEAGAPAAG